MPGAGDEDDCWFWVRHDLAILTQWKEDVPDSDRVVAGPISLVESAHARYGWLLLLTLSRVRVANIDVNKQVGVYRCVLETRMVRGTEVFSRAA